MRKRIIAFSILMVIVLLMLVAVGCQKANQQANTTQSTTQTTVAKKPHPSGAINLSDFPELKDKAIVEQAIKNMSSMKSYKIITHVTGRKDRKTIADTDYEIIYLAPDKAYFFGDDTVAGKRMEIFQLGNTEYKSFDGKKWTKTEKEFPEYSFRPENIAEMYKQGKNFHVISNDRPVEKSKSCTAIIFERPSPVYKGETEQVDFWIDNATKNIVRIEIMSNENKPSTFREEFLRFSEFNNPNLKIELYPEAEAAK